MTLAKTPILFNGYMCMKTQREAEVAVIIVNWNRWELCLQCLESLRTTEGACWHLYIVDNASTDSSREKLKSLGSDVTYTQSDINGGWTGGNNIGIKFALDSGHSRFFIMNNDARVEPDTLRLLNEAVTGRQRQPILGPLQKHPDGSGYSFTGADMDPKTGMPGMPETLDFKDVQASMLPDERLTTYIQGSGMFVSADHFRTIGLFDDRFYLNYDETDWCFRARKAGFDLIMLKAAQIEHDGFGTIGGSWSPIHVYFYTRNGLLFSKLHCDPAQRRRYLRKVIWEGFNLTGRRGWFKRLRAVLFSREPRLRAYRRALQDYATRRFGDCPVLIRDLQAADAR